MGFWEPFLLYTVIFTWAQFGHSGYSYFLHCNAVHGQWLGHSAGYSSVHCNRWATVWGFLVALLPYTVKHEQRFHAHIHLFKTEQFFSSFCTVHLDGVHDLSLFATLLNLHIAVDQVYF